MQMPSGLLSDWGPDGLPRLARLHVRLKSADEWTKVIHTYRRRRPENRLRRARARLGDCLLPKLFIVELIVVPLALVWLLLSRPHGWTPLVVFIAWCGLVMVPLGAYWSRTYCREIRLGDEGVCEFKMRWRVLRSHVAQITSIEEQVDEDGDRSYHMRLRDGTKLWTYGLTDFEDFLTRIERMSPTTQIKWHRSWRQRRQEKKRRAGEQCERVGGADE
jgi:hypothetical protein